MDRRQFLRRSAVAGVGLGLSSLVSPSGAEEAPRVRRRVRLGRTELRVPDIGFGSSRLSDDPDLVRHAIDRGISYFDTAEGYTRGRAETTIGAAVRGKRDRVDIAWPTPSSSSYTTAVMRNILRWYSCWMMESAKRCPPMLAWGL